MGNGDFYYIDMGYIPKIHTVLGRNRSFQIEPSLIISIKEIQKYFSLIQGMEYIPHRIEYNCTLEFRLNFLKGNPTGIITEAGGYCFTNWIADYPEDFKEINLKVIDIVNDFAFLCIEKYASVKAVDELLNENLGRPLVYSGMIPTRAIRGIIAGKLVGRKNLDEIIKYYDPIMAVANPQILVYYETLKSMLHDIPVVYQRL